MIKALVLDADGVVVQKKQRFSEQYAQKLGLPLETVQPFFQNEFQECLIGVKDLKIELEKQLSAWGWTEGVDKLLDYWFQSESQLNKPLLKYLATLKKHGLKIYLGTNNEKYRTEYLLETVGLKNHVHQTYASYSIGHKKPSLKYFAFLIQDLNLPPNQILFFDDDPKNVDAAKLAGINAHLYTSLTDFKKTLLKYL